MDLNRDEVRGDWRRIYEYNEELCDLYSSNIIRVIKSRRLRWVGHVERMEDKRCAHRVLVRKPEGKRSFGNPDIDGRILQKIIFKKLVGGM
jgi:hypothetical protein